MSLKHTTTLKLMKFAESRALHANLNLFTLPASDDVRAVARVAALSYATRMRADRAVSLDPGSNFMTGMRRALGHDRVPDPKTREAYFDAVMDMLPRAFEAQIRNAENTFSVTFAEARERVLAACALTSVDDPTPASHLITAATAGMVNEALGKFLYGMAFATVPAYLTGGERNPVAMRLPTECAEVLNVERLAAATEVAFAEARRKALVDTLSARNWNIPTIMWGASKIPDVLAVPEVIGGSTHADALRGALVTMRANLHSAIAELDAIEAEFVATGNLEGRIEDDASERLAKSPMLLTPRS